jgi:hypothetical protein
MRKDTHRKFALNFLLFAILTAVSAFGWGDAHSVITRAALSTLPSSDAALLGNEREPLSAGYCLIPDWVYKKDGNERFVWDFMGTESYSGRFENFHLPWNAASNYEMLEYYIRHAVASFKANDAASAARHLGVLAHMLEDWTCPAHSSVGDNMYRLLGQYMPAPAGKEHMLLHAHLESGGFDLSGYTHTPVALGATTEEVAFRLLSRAQAGTVFARGRVLDIVRAVYAEDKQASAAAQRPSAILGADLVADAFRSVCALARGEAPPPAPIALTPYWPNEAPSLFYPQAAFFSSPYWGHPQRDMILRDGKDPVPLALQISGERTEVKGLGIGVKRISWFLPGNLFSRIMLRVGLHADLGTDGQVTFRVFGNDAELHKTELRGTAQSVPIDLPITGVTNLAFLASPINRSKANYVVLADPMLIPK